MVRLVCERGMQLQKRQYDCNGAAACTFCVAMIVVCLIRVSSQLPRETPVHYCTFPLYTFSMSANKIVTGFERLKSALEQLTQCVI